MSNLPVPKKVYKKPGTPSVVEEEDEMTSHDDSCSYMKGSIEQDPS